MKHEQFQLLLQEGKNYLCHALLAVLVDMPQEVFSHKLVAVFIRSQMSHRDRRSRFIYEASIIIISSSGGGDVWNRVHLTGITLSHRYLLSMMMAAGVK